MAQSLIRHSLKNVIYKEHGLFLSCLRTCNQDVNWKNFSDQTSKESSGNSYMAPEYYQYNEYSFNDVHMEMEKYRLPRPSSKTKEQNK